MRLYVSVATAAEALEVGGMIPCPHCQRKPPRHRAGCPGSPQVRCDRCEACPHCKWWNGAHHKRCTIVKRHLLYPDVALPGKP